LIQLISRGLLLLICITDISYWERG